MKYIGFPRPSYPLALILESRYQKYQVFEEFVMKRNIMKSPILKLDRFLICLLTTFFLLQVQIAKGESSSESISTALIGESSNLTVPADVSAWMDVELSSVKRKTLLVKERFFTKDSATVIGYVKGYRPDLGFTTISLDASNDINGEAWPVVSEIDSTGRFKCAISMEHPNKVSISFGERFMSLYLEPGQVLALSFKWEDFLRTNGFRGVSDPCSILLFRGPLAKMNYELMNFQLKTIGYRHYWIKNTYSPVAYLAVMDSILVENETRVKDAIKNGAISKRVIEIQKNDALISNGFYLLDYSMAIDTGKYSLPSNFYSMFRQLPLNDPTSIISDFFDGFINRFEHNTVINKAYRTEEIDDVKYYESERLIKEWGRKDSLLKCGLNLTNCFAYEVTKTRSLSAAFERMDKNEAYAFYSRIQKDITHPYLKQEGFRILKSRFGKEDKNHDFVDGGINFLPSKLNEETKWTPLSLPEGKDADIFRKLILPYKGKYLFIDFWGTTCGPCRWGIEEKKKTREKFKNNGEFEIIFITCKIWSPDKIAYDKYIKEQGLENSFFVTNDDFNYMMQLFRFTSLPHYLFIDPDGNVLDTDFEMCFGFEKARERIQKK